MKVSEFIEMQEPDVRKQLSYNTENKILTVGCVSSAADAIAALSKMLVLAESLYLIANQDNSNVKVLVGVNYDLSQFSMSDLFCCMKEAGVVNLVMKNLGQQTNVTVELARVLCREHYNQINCKDLKPKLAAGLGVGEEKPPKP